MNEAWGRRPAGGRENPAPAFRLSAPAFTLCENIRVRRRADDVMAIAVYARIKRGEAAGGNSWFPAWAS
jgi:hypothetical protein